MRDFDKREDHSSTTVGGLEFVAALPIDAEIVRLEIEGDLLFAYTQDSKWLVDAEAKIAKRVEEITKA